MEPHFAVHTGFESRPEVHAYRPSRPGALLGIVLLVACWVQFTNIWYWPPTEALELGKLKLPEPRMFSAPFQYALWAAIAGALFLLIRREGLRLFRDLAIFWPLGLMMLVSSALGISLAPSLRIAGLWFFSILGGAVIGAWLDRDTLLRWLVGLMAATMVASVLSFVFLPAYGGDWYEGRSVLRGLFDNKNQAGRIAGLVLALSYALRTRMGSLLFFVLLTSSGLCAVLSGSMTGLVGGVLAAAYLRLIELKSTRVTSGLASLVLAALVLFLAATVILVGPILADALGRDMTLTGRTYIWEVYLRECMDYLAFGAGPGNLTNVSPITIALANKLAWLGNIYYPHNFFIGVLGDLGLPGLVCVLLLFGYLAVLLPMRSREALAFAAAATVVTTTIQGLTETLDAASPGPTWFFAALFVVAHWRGDADEDLEDVEEHEAAAVVDVEV